MSSGLPAWVLDGLRYRSTNPAHRIVIGTAQQSRRGCGSPHELLGSLIPAEVEGLSDAIIVVGDTEIPLEEFGDVGLYFEEFQSEGHAIISLLMPKYVYVQIQGVEAPTQIAADKVEKRMSDSKLVVKNGETGW